MTRFARVPAPGVVHHVISRFVNREHRFLDDEDRAEYLRRAGAAAKRTDWLPLGYALMSSHVHWALLAGEDPSSSFIHPLHAGFAHWLNRKHDRLGPVFAERHTTIACDDAHAARVLAYIHNNPVRAGLVGHAVESDWTSHKAYLGMVRPPSWLRLDGGLSLLGLRVGGTDFDEFVRAEEGTDRASLDEPDVDELRAVAGAATGAPVEVSSPALMDGRVGVAVLAVEGMRARPPWSGGAMSALVRVAECACVSVEELRSRCRRRRVASARRLALRVWCEHLGRAQTEMRLLLGLSASSACELLGCEERQEEAVRIAEGLRDEIPQGCNAETEKPKTVPT